MKPTDILNLINDDEIILFNSLAGKDSIMLTHLCANKFKKVHCVFMYMIEDLDHMNRFKSYFEKTYNNLIFYETPHFARVWHLKNGSLGCEQDKKLKLTSLSKITKDFKEKLNLKWTVYGSKQMDGLSRRLQLKTYDHEAIDFKGFKCYPLSKLTNKQVLEFIRFNDLIKPLNYGDKRPSQSNDLVDPVFLDWCRKNEPNDYQKIKKEFPEIEVILFRYDNKRNNNS